MKYCGYCGHAFPDDMIFCPKCGKKQTGETEASETVNKPENETETVETAIDPIKTVVKPVTNQKKTPKKKLIVIGAIAAAAVVAGLAIILVLGRGTDNSEKEAAMTATEEPTAEPTEEPFTIVGNTEAIEKISRSVVKLTCYDEFGNEYASGSGFFAFENNLIVTNYHVIEGNVYSIKASSDGKVFSVDYLVNYNERYDLAILKVKDSEIKSKKLDFEPLPIGDSSSLKVSEHITAIGVPLGVSKTVSDGMVSGFYEDNGVNLIQFTAPISPGSSGGALLNDRGEVVGITSASFSDGQNFNLTVPSSYISILYNAKAKEQMIAAFHNKFDHYYSVDYCLANHDVFHGQEITIYGYVSSYWKSSDDFRHFYIVSDFSAVDGTYYVASASKYLSQKEAQEINDHLDNEVFRAFNLKCIEVYFLDNIYEDDSLFVPGNQIIITGKISEHGEYEKYPGKTLLILTPTSVEKGNRDLH
ncbi:MAG: trypsin-like peptidase domain-containing protein [Clostridia bacterium]|nr:trypsin-like peptidase domain-containing protein [Clostridia bacterium]